MVRFVSLSSGSNGNCYYIGNEEVGLLIDMGIGGRTIKKRLCDCGIDFNTVKMILVTHEHLDHIKSLGTFTQRFKKPVYTTTGLHSVLNNHFSTKGLMCECIRDTQLDMEYECLGIKFTPFRVPHDAKDTVGYYIDFFGETFTFITDIGEITDTVVEYCRKPKHLIIEANYDIDMLMQGSYPHDLKMRIITGRGHLSNEQTASLIKRSYNENIEDIFLCHLSENNNTPTLAHKVVRNALIELGVEHIEVTPLPRRCASKVYEY